MPLVLSYPDLLQIPATSIDSTLVSIGRRAGGEQIGHARWRGVPLRLLLDELGADNRFAHTLITSADGRTASLRREQLEGGLLAYAINDDPLPAALGFPARLIIPGLYDYKLPGWVTKIELSERPTPGFWEARGWSTSGEVRTLSLIETPHPGEKVHAAVQFSGIAYAGMRRIARIEISVDDGEWTAIAFNAGEPGCWSRWAFEWHPPVPGIYSLRVRATDETGETQAEDAADLPFPNGSSAIHRIIFEVA